MQKAEGYKKTVHDKVMLTNAKTPRMSKKMPKEFPGG
jgi:hypothetical protein